MRRACEEIRRAVLAGDYGSAGGNGKDLFWQLSESTSATMGGSSGVLTSVFLRAMSRRLGSGEGGSGESWRDGVVAGTAAVMERGGATVGDRTLVDALKPATDVLARMGSLEEAAVAAGNGCESTKGMRAKFGRSVHVRDEQLDVEDPGAAAICVIFDALVKAKI